MVYNYITTHTRTSLSHTHTEEVLREYYGWILLHKYTMNYQTDYVNVEQK